MGFDYTLRSGRKRLRCGYTTGTCAALAAAGAVELLLTGTAPEQAALITPKGLRVEVGLEDCRLTAGRASCAVRKDAGDDPDVTDGMLVYATVKKTERGITIDGGEGVGRVTKPGLDQAVGEAAINTVPRKMIRAAIEEVCAERGYGGGIAVTVSIPGGAERAKKTFNPMLGIEGGLSVLGTSGIVEPMSEQALVDTIAVELRQRAAEDRTRVILTPGNYGLDFLRRGYPELETVGTVKCSNYLGEALDLAAIEGFREVLLVGHVGKLVKLAGGVMNTHSHVADCRRELFCAHAAVCGAGPETCRALMAQVTSDGCLAVLEQAGLQEQVMESLCAAIQEVLDRRVSGAYAVGAVLFSNEYGLLGKTEGAEKLLNTWRKKQ